MEAKKLILAAVAVTGAIGVFAQGTIWLDNYEQGRVVTHVYAPLAASPSFSQIGNGTADYPAGTTDWTAFTPISVCSTNYGFGPYGFWYTFAQLLVAPGQNAPESSLVPAGPVSRFSSAGCSVAGFLQGAIVTATNVAMDAPAATVEMTVWDNSSGNYPTWTQASVAWLARMIAAGKSGTLNVGPVGGISNSPPYLIGLQSFNLYFFPEPRPNLAISRAANGVVVSWPNTGSYTLQQNSNVAAPASWSTSSYSITTNANGTNSITITPPTGNLFFRLKQ